jgi:transposase
MATDTFFVGEWRRKRLCFVTSEDGNGYVLLVDKKKPKVHGSDWHSVLVSMSSDDNLGMGIWYSSGNWLDGYEYEDDFLSVSGIRIRSESRRVFYPPVGNPTGTRYFTTVIILGCK